MKLHLIIRNGSIILWKTSTANTHKFVGESETARFYCFVRDYLLCQIFTLITFYSLIYHRVPEIGEDLPEKNPLLRDDGLPEFNSITIEKCIGAIGQQAIDVEKGVKNLEDSLQKQEDAPNVIKDVLVPLEKIGAPLETTWGLAKTLYLGNKSLMPTKSYLTIHDRARRARGAKFNSLSIYDALNNADTKQLTEEEKRLVSKYTLEGKLNGIEIEGSKKFELNEIVDKLGKERAKFRNKIEVAIKQFNHVINDPSLMMEFPPSLLQSLATDQSQPVKGPWKITLQPYVATNFLEYCPDRTLRWNLWQADNRKCSSYTDKSLENSTHLEVIRSLRSRQAKLLGYDTFMDMSMCTKMAQNVTNVRNTLTDLYHYARPAQEAEIKALEAFANDAGHKGPLDIFDVPYWKRRHLMAEYKYDQESIREFFPVPKILSGLFDLSEKLFGVKIVERSGVDVWHEDVKYFDIFDAKDGKSPIAGFYTDLYARDEEKMFVSENTAWMVGIRNRSKITNTLPLSALICNFPAPIYGKPSLLTIPDVQMLFHKFGHTLQHLLTQSNYSELAGLSNIEWDAVEVCGHVLSHLMYDSATLKSITSHYATEETLSDQMMAVIQDYKIHLAGFDLCRELYFSNLDIELHTTNDFWLEIVKKLWPLYHAFPLDKKDAHPCSMGSIVSGDWGGAYYSHIWSRIVAADVYSAFYEAKSENDYKEVGHRFKETFLSLGGSCHPSEVFRRFRGRDPAPKALLKTLKLYRYKDD